MFPQVIPNTCMSHTVNLLRLVVLEFVGSQLGYAAKSLIFESLSMTHTEFTITVIILLYLTMGSEWLILVISVSTYNLWSFITEEWIQQSLKRIDQLRSGTKHHFWHGSSLGPYLTFWSKESKIFVRHLGFWRPSWIFEPRNDLKSYI